MTSGEGWREEGWEGIRERACRRGGEGSRLGVYEEKTFALKAVVFGHGYSFIYSGIHSFIQQVFFQALL